MGLRYIYKIKARNNFLLKSSSFRRFYQSDSVFGYRKPDNSSQYTVPDKLIQNRNEASNLYRLVTAYRIHGHKYSSVDAVPFQNSSGSVGDYLDVRKYGFNDLNQKIQLNDGIVNFPTGETTLRELVEYLNRIYCSHLCAEFEYLEDEDAKEWFAKEFEAISLKEVSRETKISLAKLLIKSQAFDNFLARRFSSVKRWQLKVTRECEIQNCLNQNVRHIENLSVIFGGPDPLEQIVLALPHRGRLNLLTGLLNYPPAQIFSKLKGNPDFPEKYRCSGDVLSHKISSTDLYFDDQSIHVSVLYNPSHLEAVNPVSMGKTRAKQMMLQGGPYYGSSTWGEKILNIQVHGDAALAGQGVNQECLMMSGVPHFEIGGTVHFVVNNQVGFTTPTERGRCTRYCTDLAKMIGAPVIHVNGDHPEEVVKATRLAFNYQRTFRKDIFIDMNCFRKWGHNEMDDPTFTNPALYRIINSRKSVPDLYSGKLFSEGILNEQEYSEIYDEHFDWLNEELNASAEWQPKDVYFKSQWQEMRQPEAAVSIWDTGIDVDLMTFIGEKSVKYPENFKIHPTIFKGHVKNRLSRVAEGLNIDWSTAEALAIGSILFEGHNVRISGQDIGRGTFSQRHAMLVDQDSNSIHVPLNHIHPEQHAFLELANSILSEEAVLGYEYGMSIENPKNLIIWEAQFGDFFNGAQIIFDTFISAGEAKWIYQSGLTILLPHGYDGAGPEHSSCRIERFLQLTDSKEDQVDGDDVNMQVCYPSTPAQYFHLLRRQMIRNFRKPLIVITPKILLRAPECVSKFADMVKGTHFKPVIGDTTIAASKVKRVLLTSGKHYYSLVKEREAMGVADTAIVRVECFCPFPTLELIQETSLYENAKSFIWCQEEHQNMGAWTFFKRRFENLVGKSVKYCGRATLATPAVGVAKIHQKEVTEILTKPFLM